MCFCHPVSALLTHLGSLIKLLEKMFSNPKFSLMMKGKSEIFQWWHHLHHVTQVQSTSHVAMDAMCLLIQHTGKDTCLILWYSCQKSVTCIESWRNTSQTQVKQLAGTFQKSKKSKTGTVADEKRIRRCQNEMQCVILNWIVVWKKDNLWNLQKSGNQLTAFSQSYRPDCDHCTVVT